MSVFTGSVHMDIWNFSLGNDDMAEIAKLDIGHSEIVNHCDPGFVKMLHGVKIHEWKINRSASGNGSPSYSR